MKNNIPKAAQAYFEANYTENCLSKEFLEAADIPKELWPLRYMTPADKIKSDEEIAKTMELFKQTEIYKDLMEMKNVSKPF